MWVSVEQAERDATERRSGDSLNFRVDPVASVLCNAAKPTTLFYSILVLNLLISIGLLNCNGEGTR